MFDDLNKNDNAINNKPIKPGQKGMGQLFNSAKDQKMRPDIRNLPKKQVEDIFSETDKNKNVNTGKPEPFKPKSLENQELGDNYEEKNVLQTANVKKIIIFAIMTIGLLVCILIIVWGLSKINFVSPAQVNEDMRNINKDENKNKDISNNDDYSAAKNTKEELKNKASGLFDTDGDGLTDKEEKELGTDINNVDTDDDGLFDREEVKVYKTDPLNADTDGDGYLDGEEIKKGDDPKGEGKLLKLPINEEINNKPNEDENGSVVKIDTDSDGLLDIEEEKFGTDILKIDTDSDGLSDYEEVKVYKTNPLNADTDGDGFLDGEEVESEYNPLGEGML